MDIFNNKIKREMIKLDKFLNNNSKLYDSIIYYTMRRIPKATQLVHKIIILEEGPEEEMLYFKEVLDSYNEMNNYGCCIGNIIYLYIDRLKAISSTIVVSNKYYKNINKIFIQIFVGALVHEIYHIIDCNEMSSEEFIKLNEEIKKNGFDQECENRVNNEAIKFIKKHIRKLFRKLLLI